MLQQRINTTRIWYAKFAGSDFEVDENGDFTGAKKPKYSAVSTYRGNLSPARGVAENDIFGSNLRYSKTLSVSKMTLGIDEQTIIWDTEPVLDAKGEVDPKTAKYRVVGVAKGHYHIHYALRQMNPDESEGE